MASLFLQVTEGSMKGSCVEIGFSPVVLYVLAGEAHLQNMELRPRLSLECATLLRYLILKDVTSTLMLYWKFLAGDICASRTRPRSMQAHSRRSRFVKKMIEIFSRKGMEKKLS